MVDLKVMNSVLDQLQEERGVPKVKMLEAIEMALATAYRKEYGKRGQIIRAKFDSHSGKTDFFQVKIVVDKTRVFFEEDLDKEEKVGEAKKTGHKTTATEGVDPSIENIRKKD